MEARRGILFLFFLVAGTFVFSADFAFASGPTDVYLTTITEPTTWTKKNSPYILHYKLTVKKKLVIEPGVVVKFASAGTGIDMLAEISAVGTKNEKIVFTSIHDDSVGGNSDAGAGERAPGWGDWDKISTHSDRVAKFENVVVSYASTGIMSQSTGSQYENLEIKNSEIKNNITGIDISNLSPVIESNVISGNYTGISTKLNASYPERTTVVRYNSFSGNSTGIFTSNTFALKPPTVDAKENWWGSDTGPYNNLKNKGGSGDSVSDYWIAFDPWLKVDPSVGLDPVIIIPGIMGSWEVGGKWKIDPLLHSYENLKKAMENAGYVEGESMFDFPYQWRNSNIKNAELLRDAVNAIKEKTGRPKVDVVSHSMGGLIAREYIESDYYQNDVDQLITLGTPQAGSPKAYLIWEAGEADSYLEDKILKMIFNREAKKAGYENIFYYAREKIPSLQELLPTFDYIFDLDLNVPRIYPEKYPRNIFLENINSSGKTSRLQKVEFDNIYGKTNKKSTIGGYNVINAPAFGDYWKNGYPKDFNIPWSSDGLVYVAGDGTVPENSATYLKDDRNIEINASHNQIPTEAQQDVIELLTGKRPASKITSEGPEIKEILLVQVYCPVDITVIDPHGKVVGKNKNDIEGAVYINNGDDEEFLTIPNPEDGEYRILTEGTGTGDYTIETTKITEDEKTGEAVETTATFTGTAEPEVQEENKIEIDGDSVKKVEPLTLSLKKKEPDAGREEKINTEIPQAASSDVYAQLSENPTKIEQLDALKNSVRYYFKKNKIKSRKEAKKITEKLSHIRVYLKRQETGALPKKMKIYKTKANHDMDKLISRVRRNSPKKIDEEAKNDLVECLNSLKL